MNRASLARLTAIYFRVGNSTFGGGDPTMAVLHSELVRARGWLTAERYGLVYALARVTPGTNLLAFCAGTAWEILGWPAALLAVAAVSLPSAAAVVALTIGYEAFHSNGLAMAAIAATLAAAAGMMAAGAFQLLRPHLKPRRRLRAVVIASAAFAASFWLSPVTVLALAAAAGLLWK